ncbi:MAG: hypothetical protein ACXACI_12145 [Candidatus Hodarchaeales archaeon]
MLKINPPYLKFIVFSGGGGLVIREQGIKLTPGRNILEVQDVPSSFDEDTVAVELENTEAKLIEIVAKKPDRRFVEDAMSRERQASEKILSESVDMRTEIRSELLRICEGVQARRYEDSASDFGIIIDAEKEEQGTIRISYFIGDSRIWWTPSLQIDLNDDKARVTGYILVENHTNLNFEDVELEFAEFEGVRRRAAQDDFQAANMAMAAMPQPPPPPGAPAPAQIQELRGEMLKELRKMKKIG